MTRVLLLAVGLILAHESGAVAAPGGAPAALRRAGESGQPAPAEPDAAEQATPSPPADVSTTPPAAAQPTQPGEQTIEDDSEANEPEEPAAGGTPRDLATFAESTMGARRLRFALNAFGDATLVESIPETDVPAGAPKREERSAFQLGVFALLINGQLGSSLLGTAEVAFDVKNNTDQDVKLERLQLRWQTERYFLAGGRLHTDIGYWNAAFHHGAWLFLPVVRPRVVLGEASGGLLPIHWIGIEGGVNLPIDPGVLTVSGGIGNGRGDAEGIIQLRGDSNDFKALKLKVEYQGLGLPDLRVGVGGLYDHIAAGNMTTRPALENQEIDEYIGNVFTAYRGAQMTLIAEGYGIWHRGDDQTFTTTDAFVVAGYRVGRVTPYVMVERTDALGDEVDPFYTPVPDMATASTPVDQTNAVGGVRLDVSVWSAIKAEYGMLYPDHAAGPDHTVRLNWSFGI